MKNNNFKTRLKKAIKIIAISVGIVFIIFAVLTVVIGTTYEKKDKPSDDTSTTTTAITTTEDKTTATTLPTTELTTASTTKITTTEKIKNILMTAEIKEAPVMNGFKTEQIGTYAYVKLSNKEFEALTPENYAEFANTKVKDSGYNYFSIITDNGKGACWAGSQISVLSFGKIDADACITNTTATWILQGDTYSE